MRTITIALFFLLSGFSQINAQEKYYDKYPYTINVEVDQLGNIYLLNQEKIIKLSPDLKEICSYQNSNLGSILSFDVSNPFKILIFSSDFNQLVITDNNFNEISALIDLSPISDKITGACNSINNGYWLFDGIQNQIVFTDENMNVQFRSIRIENNSDIQFLLEKNRKLYVYNSENLIIADEYGTFLNQFNYFENTQLNIEKNTVFYIHKNTISAYNLQNFTERVLITLQSKPLDFSIKNNKLYLINENGGLEIHNLN